MPWLDTLNVNETIALIGVLTGFLGAATAIITARWTRRVAVSGEAVAALTQLIDLFLIRQLATGTDRIPVLEEKLAALNTLLRKKTADIPASKIAAATALGPENIFLGITDAELFARALAGLITSNGKIIDFGEADLSVKSFYTGFMRLLLRNDIVLEHLIGTSPERILNYVILPMLACAKYKTLEPAIGETLENLFEEMRKTPRSAEVPIYMEALERAKSGQDFSSLHLPADLFLKLADVTSS